MIGDTAAHGYFLGPQGSGVTRLLGQLNPAALRI
jgi:hypothetical protein